MKKIIVLALGLLLSISVFAAPDLNVQNSTSTVTQQIEKVEPAQKSIVDIAAEAIPAVVIVEVDVMTYNIFTGEMRVGQNMGSGFFINNKGHLITNRHVIQERLILQSGPVDPRIIYKDGDKIKTVYAEILAIDKENDIALLKLYNNEKSSAYLEFADSDKCKVGEEVIAIGHPLGFCWSLTTGVISNLHRKFMGWADDALQITAPINPGNSGGPLLNREGKVVGMNVGIITPSWFPVFTGIGVSISANQINKFLDKYRI